MTLNKSMAIRMSMKEKEQQQTDTDDGEGLVEEGQGGDYGISEKSEKNKNSEIDPDDLEMPAPPPLQRAQARQISRVGATAIAGIGAPSTPPTSVDSGGADSNDTADPEGATIINGDCSNPLLSSSISQEETTPPSQLPSAVNVTATLVTDDEYEAEIHRVIMSTAVRASKVEAIREEPRKLRPVLLLTMLVGSVLITIVLASAVSLLLPGPDGNTSREEALVAFLKERSFDGGVSLREYASPQKSALRFIAAEFPNAIMDEKLIDIYAVSTLFYSTGATTFWKNFTKWKSNDPVCIWYGIGCDSNGYVVSIELSNNGLGGTIPPDLGMLSPRRSTDGRIAIKGLRKLDLSKNEIAGQIPNELGLLKSMEEFVVYGNRLSGPIPQSLSNWTLAHNVSITQNNLLGKVPDELCTPDDPVISVDCATVGCACCVPACQDPSTD